MANDKPLYYSSSSSSSPSYGGAPAYYGKGPAYYGGGKGPPTMVAASMAVRSMAAVLAAAEPMTAPSSERSP